MLSSRTAGRSSPNTLLHAGLSMDEYDAYDDAYGYGSDDAYAVGTAGAARRRDHRGRSPHRGHHQPAVDTQAPPRRRRRHHGSKVSRASHPHAKGEAQASSPAATLGLPPSKPSVAELAAAAVEMWSGLNRASAPGGGGGGGSGGSSAGRPPHSELQDEVVALRALVQAERKKVLRDLRSLRRGWEAADARARGFEQEAIKRQCAEAALGKEVAQADALTGWWRTHHASMQQELETQLTTLHGQGTQIAKLSGELSASQLQVSCAQPACLAVCRALRCEARRGEARPCPALRCDAMRSHRRSHGRGTHRCASCRQRWRCMRRGVSTCAGG